MVDGKRRGLYDDRIAAAIRTRKQQPLMRRAYCDASGSGDPDALALAGYIADSDTWGDFSAAWQAKLDECHLPYFKMHDMVGRPEIAAYFYRTIEEFNIQAAISCVVHTKDLVRAVRSFAWPTSIKAQLYNLENPYFYAFKAIVESIAREQISFGMTEPIDFVFDDQSEAAQIAASWRLFKFAASSKIQPLLGELPAFQDDTKVMPLQAADLYAWWVLRWQRSGNAAIGAKERRFAWGIKRKIPTLHFELGEDRLRRGFEGILDRAEVLRIESALGKRGLVQEVRPGGWGRVDFECDWQIKAVEFKFYDDDDDALEPDADSKLEFQRTAARARIFIKNKDNSALNAAEMLDYYLAQSCTKIEDHIPPQEAAKSIREGQRTFTASFPISFARDCFCMKTEGGFRDLSQLSLVVEFIVNPKIRNH